MSNLLGERIFPDQSAWKQTIWGTVILSFACALPIVGWFLLLPYVGFVGIGAFILGLFQRENN
jgi:sorbitol-specific phosphotransferase system component IIBC